MTDRRTDEESINKKQRSQIDGERASPEVAKIVRVYDYREGGFGLSPFFAQPVAVC